MKLVVLMAAAAAAVATTQPVTGERLAARVPSTWKPLPDAAAAVESKLGGAGGAVAFGDARSGVFAVAAWTASARPVASDRARAEAEGVLAELHGGLGKGATWTRADVARRLGASFAVASADAEQVGRAAVVVDGQGSVHGYLVTCTRSGDARTRPEKIAPARAACDAFLASLAFTWRDDELRTLEGS